MEADDTVHPSFAELRTKYDETTRLLSAQCDTIERLQAQIRTLSRQPGTNGGVAKPDEGECVAESCAEVADESTAGFETKYRRAKRLVKMQAVEVATLRERVQRRAVRQRRHVRHSRVAEVERVQRRAARQRRHVRHSRLVKDERAQRREARQRRHVRHLLSLIHI